MHIPSDIDWNTERREKFNCMSDMVMTAWVFEDEYVKRNPPSECKYYLEHTIMTQKDKGE